MLLLWSGLVSFADVGVVEWSCNQENSKSKNIELTVAVVIGF